MPSLSSTWHSATLLLLALFHFTSAIPFTPIINRPIPIINNGLNLYPEPQEELEDYTFTPSDAHFDRNFYTPVRQQQQRGLMGKIHGEFLDEIPEDVDEYENYDQWNFNHEEPQTGGDAFQRSSSNNVGGWGTLKATPPGRKRIPERIAKIIPDSFFEHKQERDRKRDLDAGVLSPQAICDFLQLPLLTCENGLSLPQGLPNIPIISISVEDVNFADQGSEPGALPEGTTITGDPFYTMKTFEDNPDELVPVFLNIEFLPSAAAALDVENTAPGMLQMSKAELLADMPYTETYYEYHQVDTVCVTREIGPLIVCERVYGTPDADDGEGGDDAADGDENGAPGGNDGVDDGGAPDDDAPADDAPGDDDGAPAGDDDGTPAGDDGTPAGDDNGASDANDDTPAGSDVPNRNEDATPGEAAEDVNDE